jgi:hemerythrin superfamily protein
MNQSQERLAAAQLPEGSVIAVLLEQHARIRDLFGAVKSADGARKQELFDELRELLAVHEAGEEMVLRPISRKTAGEQVAEDRDQEEETAASTLAELEKMDARDPLFDAQFAHFEQAVSDHADREESAEFPSVLRAVSAQDQLDMGGRLSAAQRMAPTHPHPRAAGSTAAQYLVGPFASLLDHARDAYHRRQD